jgi:hypothetical protein
LSSRGLLPKMTACKTKTKSPWLGTIRGTQSFVCYSTQQNTSSFRVTASIYRYGDISKRLGSLFIFSLLLLHSPSLPHPNSLPHFSLRPLLLALTIQKGLGFCPLPGFTCWAQLCWPWSFLPALLPVCD